MSLFQEISRVDAAARDEITVSRFAGLARCLCDIARSFYERGWAFGTGGNYSLVLTHNPLHLAITASGVDKKSLLPSQVVLVDEWGHVLDGNARPSYESLLHLSVIRSQGAGAVLHTHSVWGTILSRRYAAVGGFAIHDFEMLKGLEGVTSHEHREWVPIFQNSQDIPLLATAVEHLLNESPSVHGFLLEGHGLYTWGKNASQAVRHVEIFEFLFEVLGRSPATALADSPD